MAFLKRFLTEDEQRRLLAAPRAMSSDLAKRDFHMLRLLIETGMRVGEFCSLTLAQAERALASGWLVVSAGQRKGKTHGHEYLVTGPVREALQGLVRLNSAMALAALPAGAETPLVWGDGKGGQAHIHVRSVQHRVKVWAHLAGLPDGVSPHWLRHTRGVNIIRRSRGNNPLKVAQLALGHVSIASTGIYTQMARDELERELHAVAGGRVRKQQAREQAQGVTA